jgi:arsenate reductase
VTISIPFRLYGIKNCDTVRKARKWLDAEGIPHEFIDFREQGLESKKLSQWLAAVGMDKLLNKRSTTWKNLDDSEKQLDSTEAVINLLIAHPTLIKRPVLESTNSVMVGFSEKDYQAFTQ